MDIVKFTVKGLEIQVDGKQNIITDGINPIELKGNQKIKVIKSIANSETSFKDIIVVKEGESITLVYSDGSSLSIEGFYSVENLTLELPVSESQTHLLSSNVEVAHFDIVYSQGDLNTFKPMFTGNEVVLNGINESLVTGEAVAGGAISNTALAIGGVIGAGSIVALKNNSSSSSNNTPTTDSSVSSPSSTSTTDSSGSSSSGSSSSSSSSGGSSSGGGSGGSSSAPVTVTAQFIDSAVSGVSVYKNGTLIGTTNHDGYFDYSGTTGDVIEFRVGQTVVGNINYEDISSDGIVTVQDLEAVDRTDTSNTNVVAIAQLLQTLDADGDASNGIQILTNSNGDVVLDANIDDNADGTVTAQEITDAKSSLTGAEEVILDVSDAATAVTVNNTTNLNTLFEAGDANGGTVTTAITATNAQAHLNSSLQDIYKNDGYTIVSNEAELDAAITDTDVAKIIITESINIFGKDMSGFTDVLVNNFDNSTALSLTMSPAQIDSFNLKTAPDDGVTAIVEVGDSDLTKYDLSGISEINTNGQNIIATVAQIKGTSINNSVGGSFEIIDSVANLTGNITGISNATQVTAVLPSDGSVIDLSGIAFDDDVTGIDLNGQTDVLATFAQTNLAANGTTLAKDTAANIIAQGSGLSADLIISDAVSIQDLQTIEANTSGTVNYSVAGIFDTAYNIWNDGGTTAIDVKFEIDGGASLAQLATINSNKGNNGTLVYNLIEDSSSNLHTGATANNPFITGDVDITITGVAGISTVAALDPLTTGVIRGTITNVLQSDVTDFENTNVNGNNVIDINVGLGYTTATASEMLTLLSATSATITATSLTSISGSGTDLITLGNASNFDVSNSLRVIGFPNISVSDANTLDGLFAGPIGGTISEGDIVTLVALTDVNSNNEFTINTTDTSATTSDLVTLIDSTTAEVNAQSVTTITGDYNDLRLLADAATRDKIELASSLNLTATDTTLTYTQIDALNTIATDVLDITATTAISGDNADLVALQYEHNQGNVLLNSNVEITVNDDFNRTEFNVISRMTDADIIVGSGASLADGLLSGIDLSNYSGLKNLTSLDVTDNTNGDSTISLTAADIFSVNDNTGDLTFDITGTNGGSDRLNLSSSDGWTQVGSTNQYTANGNFDGVAGSETYTINVTDVTVNIV